MQNEFNFYEEFEKLAKNSFFKETRKDVTNMYIQGRINKEEFLRRMENAN